MEKIIKLYKHFTSMLREDIYESLFVSDWQQQQCTINEHNTKEITVKWRLRLRKGQTLRTVCWVGPGYNRHACCADTSRHDDWNRLRLERNGVVGRVEAWRLDDHSAARSTRSWCGTCELAPNSLPVATTQRHTCRVFRYQFGQKKETKFLT